MNIISKFSSDDGFVGASVDATYHHRMSAGLAPTAHGPEWANPPVDLWRRRSRPPVAQDIAVDRLRAEFARLYRRLQEASRADSIFPFFYKHIALVARFSVGRYR